MRIIFAESWFHFHTKKRMELRKFFKVIIKSKSNALYHQRKIQKSNTLAGIRISQSKVNGFNSNAREFYLKFSLHGNYYVIT